MITSLKQAIVKMDEEKKILLTKINELIDKRKQELLDKLTLIPEIDADMFDGQVLENSYIATAIKS
jgi:hypothetical protein